MAVLNNNYLTLLDHANRIDPNGDLVPVIEMLSQDNDMLLDMPFIEANTATGHKHSVRTGLPEGTWRKLYQGVQPTKSTVDTVTDTIGMLDAYSEPDRDLVDMASSPAQYRMDEAEAHLEGMGQQIAETAIYGDTDINPERFMGLAPRYGAVSGTAISENVIDAGGTGTDNTSIWLIGWGKKKVAGIYPKGSRAGMQRDDEGKVTVQKADGSRYPAYREHFSQKVGLIVPDWRYAVRICNIDVSALEADPANGGADLFLLLSRALERIKRVDDKTVIYGNRTISSFLRSQRDRQTTVRITREQVGGRSVTMVDDVRLGRMDALINNEARVVAA